MCIRLSFAFRRPEERGPPIAGIHNEPDHTDRRRPVVGQPPIARPPHLAPKEDSGTTKENLGTTKNLGTTTNSRTTTRRRKTQERRRRTIANDMPPGEQANMHARTEGHRNNLPVSLAFRRYPAHGGRYRAGDHRATEAPLATSNNTRAYDPLHVNCFLNRSQPNPAASRLLALSCRRFAALFSSAVRAGGCALPCLGLR